MKRSTFLPMFFIALAGVFAIAVWLRLGSVEVQVDPVAGVEGELAPVDSKGTVADGATGVDAPPETGTMVPFSPDASKSRRERYDELLRSAPPAPPAAPAPPKESLLDRVVNPIASALGVGRRQQAAAAQPPARPQAAPAQPRLPDVAAPDAGEGGQAAEKPPREEEDPETDLTPPQLRHAEFLPPQVQDDGETMLAATVIDNLSGVRTVSGVIASPSGASQGFSCQREGDTDRYVTRIKVPREAAEGVWSVRYLTLSDNANNTVNLSQASGLPQAITFRVTSASSDSTPPQLRGVELERRSMNAGETNRLIVQAEDDKSGVSLVSGVFVSPSKQARIGFGCRAVDGAWECPVAPPACLDCGAWQLEQIQVYDKANNMGTFRGDNGLVQRIVLDISGNKCDSGPPQLVSLSLDPLAISNAEGGVINIAAVVQDDDCGASSLSGLAVPATAGGGQRIPFSFDPSPDGTNFAGRIIVPRHAAKGTWTISWIQALDKGHNLRAYGANEPVLSRVTFQVE